MLVQLHGTLRGLSGVRQISISPAGEFTVASALAAALAQEPRSRAALLDDAGQLRLDLLIFRNGRNIRLLHGLDTPVAGDDRLDHFPLGGAQRAFAVD